MQLIMIIHVHVYVYLNVSPCYSFLLKVLPGTQDCMSQHLSIFIKQWTG